MEKLSVLAQLIVAFAAVGTLFITWRNRHTGRDIHEVKVQTDGMKTELVAEVRKAAKAEGIIEEKENEERT